MVTAINVKEASKLKLARKLFVLILIMLLILVGCTKAGKEAATTPEPSNTDTPGNVETPEENKNHEELPETKEGNESESDETDTENNEEQPLFEVKDSPLIDGWKVLTLRDYAYSTEDWDSYSFKDSSPMISYRLHFPGNWDIEYSVFTDENGQKVAELFPPIMMKEGQGLLDNWQLSSECELISKEDIKIGNLTGVRIIFRAYPHGGDIEYWYPHTYYLTDGKRVFAMSFYTLELDTDKQKQFDGIIDSFTFLD
ncbi:MAG: hypothetical protein GX223_06955 [Tepidanaerobacter sp.]|jgi:hypothetical protein|nr:hypothetical protein [Tepidanaerobacter sp.]